MSTGYFPKTEVLLQKKNWAAHLELAKGHLDTPDGYWKNVLCMDAMKVQLFGKDEECNTLAKTKHSIPAEIHPICEALW